MKRFLSLGVSIALALSVNPLASSVAAQMRPVPGKVITERLSAGARAWWFGSQPSGNVATAPVTLGTNVDANDPRFDLATGQAETAVAAAGRRVLVAWNDATGLLVRPSTRRRASLVGVGFSSNGGAGFRDLLGLPNGNPNQQWFGDPTVVAVDGGKFFIVGGLYFPSLSADCAVGPVEFALAVSVARVSPTNEVTFTAPIVAARGGNLCLFDPPPDLAEIEKPWLAYDGASRTLVMTYERNFLGFGGQSSGGQIEIVRAHVPAAAQSLRSGDFGAPIVVWPEEPTIFDDSPYVALAPGGDAYIVWERNWISNLNPANPPGIFIQAARVRAGASSPAVGGPNRPRAVTSGQVNSFAGGGVKSLDLTPIPGYTGTGNDFPQVAYDPTGEHVVFVWNDASLHALGDIWMRALDRNLDLNRPIRKVNDDDSFALHFEPSVSVRSDGSIATSWYDRRLHGAASSKTDYFGEVRSGPSAARPDFRITTGETNWTNTSSFLTPNFGDYTNNASSGTTTYFTWTDGRIGVPQPFADSR